MRRHVLLAATAVTLGTALLASCTGKTPTNGTAGPATTSSSAELPNSGAPKVGNPLPAAALAGSPCDSALTADQLTGYLGQPTAPKTSDTELGPTCDWASASGTAAGILVGYDTKSGQGLSLAYKNVKPKAKRWVDDLQPVQGYPAVGYVDAGTTDNRACVIVVGVADDLAYSVSLSIGDSAVQAGKDACQLGRGVADTVLTNLKARA
ncbi:DUF3558 domain-containing protein [Amycolatopsis sp. NPDC051716]|uniref:DUF3558 domain-containing protein n=1 Tax=Amycolatopsis sp. NPDC051716 TaxID=3155804 RepID=UPI00342509FA